MENFINISEPRRHMTTVVRDFVSNGIKAPAPDGLCHEAWRVFDQLTAYIDGELTLPSLKDGVDNGVALGLNRGNLRVEYPRWRKYNGFPTVARRAAQ